jgi:hypothetical protein
MRRLTIGLALLAAGVGGCGNASYSLPQSESLMLSRTDGSRFMGDARAAEAQIAEPVTDTESESEDRQLLFNVRAERMIVYKGRFVLLVPEVRSAQDRIRKLAVDMDGYLESMEKTEMVIRVPAVHFDDTTDALKEIGTVARRSISAQDVTDKHFDLKTRIANHEAMSKRLRELIAKADKAEDALAIEQELARVLTDLDRLKGRLKRLDSMVAYATVAIELKGAVEYSPPTLNVDLPFAWLKRMGLRDLLRFNGRELLK